MNLKYRTWITDQNPKTRARRPEPENQSPKTRARRPEPEDQSPKTRTRIPEPVGHNHPKNRTRRTEPKNTIYSRTITRSNNLGYRKANGGLRIMVEYEIPPNMVQRRLIPSNIGIEPSCKLVRQQNSAK
jgi:hypothetical protein